MTLLREVEIYLRNTGVPKTTLGRLALNDPKAFRDLKAGSQFGPVRAEKLRAWMRDHPRGERPDRGRPPRPASSTGVAVAVQREAEQAVQRRRIAGSTGSVVRPVPHVRAAATEAGSPNSAPCHAPVQTRAERIATMLVETPGDLVATVKRGWPHLWADVLASARAARVTPGGHLISIIEAGLAAVSGEGGR